MALHRLTCPICHDRCYWQDASLSRNIGRKENGRSQSWNSRLCFKSGLERAKLNRTSDIASKNVFGIIVEHSSIIMFPPKQVIVRHLFFGRFSHMDGHPVNLSGHTGHRSAYVGLPLVPRKHDGMNMEHI